MLQMCTFHDHRLLPQASRLTNASGQRGPGRGLENQQGQELGKGEKTPDMCSGQPTVSIPWERKPCPVAGTLNASASPADDSFPASLWTFLCDVQSLDLFCLLYLQDSVFKLNFKIMSVRVV